MSTSDPYGSEYVTRGVWDALSSTINTYGTANVRDWAGAGPPPAWAILVDVGQEPDTASREEAYYAIPLFAMGAYTLWRVKWLRMSCITGASTVVDGITLYGVGTGWVGDGEEITQGTPITWQPNLHRFTYGAQDEPPLSTEVMTIPNGDWYILTQANPYANGVAITQPMVHICLGVIVLESRITGDHDQQALDIATGSGLVNSGLAGTGRWTNVVGVADTQDSVTPHAYRRY